MSFQDFVRLLRSRWLTVGVTALITLLASVLYTHSQTPLYQASTRLFVSTTFGATATELYQGNRLAQERVLSYTQLIMGTTLAQRTIDRLNLDINAATLKGVVTAKSRTGTVLIDVSVLDKSPLQARDIANALSDEFVTMVRDLETPTLGARPDARVVIEQRAMVPGQPVVPKPVRNYALGIALGLLMGLGFAVIRDLLDNTVKDRDTLERLSGVGVVGVVPFDKNRRLSKAIEFDTESSPSAEAFRKLRTNLQFLSVDDPPRLIVITSSIPNEGKSTTAVNIALALAEADKSALLIDGDMRRPSLAEYLDLIPSVGLSSILSGSASADEVLQDSKFHNLTVLTAGPTPPNPSELLGSTAARKLLTDLRGRFDYVIIDSSPLLAVTDSAVLASAADGVIILVRANKTKREQLSHALGMLNDVGAVVLGTVLSMAPSRGSGSYSYDYYYGDRDSERTRRIAMESPDRDPVNESGQQQH